MIKRKTTPRPVARTAAEADLRALLHDIARWAIASSIGAVGCSGHHQQLDVPSELPVPDAGHTAEPPPRDAGKPGTNDKGPNVQPFDAGHVAVQPIDAGTVAPVDDGWRPIDCTGRFTPRVLGNVAFKDPFDYVAIYASEAGGGQDFDGGLITAFTHMLDEDRTACATASNADVCRDALDALAEPAEVCIQEQKCTPFLLTAEGDEVTRIDARSALLTLLGPIDGEYEAALLAMFDGHPLGCPYDPGVGGGQNDLKLSGTQIRRTDDGYDLRTELRADCTYPAYREGLHVAADGVLSVTEVATQIGVPTCVAGRRPAGLCPPAKLARASALGAFFAEAARLEAASVPAFVRLAHELRALGAPLEFVAQALQSAQDEIRHTRIVGDLARRFGQEPQPLRIAAARERSAFEIALENAVEGCVRETYGALLAHHQAQAARDPQVRVAMVQIADDETRHAELSWRVARWLEPHLSEREQRACVAARKAALVALSRDLDAPFADAQARAIGWPERAIAASMLLQLGAALAIT